MIYVFKAVIDVGWCDVIITKEVDPNAANKKRLTLVVKLIDLA